MSSEITRIYPVRTTKEKWNIPLYSNHECSNCCSKIIIEDVDGYRFENNPNYIEEEKKCSQYGKLTKTCIELNNFNSLNPRGVDGKLYEPDMVVLNDNDFFIFIQFPVRNATVVNVNIKQNGLTLKDLIVIIKLIYIHVYEEEERTSTINNYTIQKECKLCENTDVNTYIEDVKENIEKEDLNMCAICQIEYDDNEFKSKLKCNHLFHRQCILRWFNNTKNCPLCRYNIVKCVECDGTGIVKLNYTGSVIPQELRGYDTDRNETDGIFGIYSHDFEDLCIKKMMYIKREKLLIMMVSDIHPEYFNVT